VSVYISIRTRKAEGGNTALANYRGRHHTPNPVILILL
jgi:hypothetical protein